MYRNLVLLAIIAATAYAIVIPSHDDVALPSSTCTNCLCQKETGCQPVGCKLVNGTTKCGFFLIDLQYYHDCGAPWFNPDMPPPQNLMRCANNIGCATFCVQNYYKRYASNCPSTMSPCESLTRIHQGGPNGCTNPATQTLANDVKSCCTTKC